MALDLRLLVTSVIGAGERRLSRPNLWESGGEIPPGDPTSQVGGWVVNHDVDPDVDRTFL